MIRSWLRTTSKRTVGIVVVVLGLGVAMLVGELAIDTGREKIAKRRRGTTR